MRKVLILLVFALSINATGFSSGFDTTKLSLPSLNWAIQLLLPGYNLQDISLDKDKEGRNILLTNKTTGMIVSVILEINTSKFKNGIEMRDYNWTQKQSFFKNNQVLIKDTAKYEFGDIAITDYNVMSYKGVFMFQKNIHAYIVKDTIGIEIHLSKVNFDNKDLDNFNNVLQSLKFINLYKHTAMEHFIDGSFYYTIGNYNLASYVYQKALILEKDQQSLEKKYFYVLIDNLGMAYGISGNLDKAIETLNYGLTIDSQFPMFYYNLACAYAEKDDIDNTIKYLSEAYKYKDNMLQGEEFPNPKKDDSFKKYLKVDKFKDALKNMKK